MGLFTACNQAPATSSAKKAPKSRRHFALFGRKQRPDASKPAAYHAVLQVELQVAGPPAGSLDSASPQEAEAAPVELHEQEAPACAAARSITEHAAALSQAAQGTRAHRAACLALSGSGEQAAAALKATTPEALAAADPTCLNRVDVLLACGTAMAAACAAPGWLLRAAAPEEGEVLLVLHADLLAALKEAGLDGGSRLPQPDCPANAARALHRRLKQLGGGSLRGGLAVVAGSEEEQHAVADALGVPPEAATRDVAYILAHGLVPNDDASAASAAVASDEAVSAHRPALQCAFEAYAAYGARDSTFIELDSFRAAKIARQAGLLAPGGGLTPQELDVLFAKAKDRAVRRLSFEGFLRLLALIASKKQLPLAQVAGAVAALQGPAAHGATTPEAVRLHDDRSTYTGVYARGGMSVIDDKSELGRMVDRSAAERASRRASASAASRRSTAGGLTPLLSRTASGAAGGLTPRGQSCGATPRGLPTVPSAASFTRPAVPRLSLPNASVNSTTQRLPSVANFSARGLAAASQARTPPLSARGPASAAAFSLAPLLSARNGPTSHALTPSAFQLTPLAAPAPPSPPSLSADQERVVRRLVDAFAAFGKSGATRAGTSELQLDASQFSKLVRDASLLGRGLSATRADLVFTVATAAQQKGVRRLSYQGLLAVLPRLAEARGCTVAEVVRRLLACEGPTRTATTTPENVRLSDRSNFCGVAARGGPSVVEKRITLEAAVDRSGRRTALAPVE